VIIRPAVPEDAAAMTALRAASIRQLCSADHRDDPVEIADWIGPPDKFSRLLAMPTMTMVVAEVDGVMAGLGGFFGDTITLNYVHPDHRFQGVSKAIMADLEARLRASGVNQGRLNTTATALPFYRSIGWIALGEVDSDAGQPMSKSL
jgi:GNAT superfamily N-acetyltransferase